jgi:pyruvate dehydrogenase E1 component alpha subunit
MIAERAVGYGIAGVRVDGNDPLAVYHVTADARARALAGDGPTLIEAVTYRLGAHTTADDPTRYVDPDEEQRWKTRDPLIRFRAWMRATGRWDDAAEEQAARWCSDEIDRAVAEVAELGPARPEQLFDNVWDADPPSLAAQRAELRAALGDPS